MSTTSHTRSPKVNHLLEESILPVRLRERTISALGFVWLWIGMAVIIATFQLGASGVAGLPLWQVLLTILLANTALAVVMTLTGSSQLRVWVGGASLLG